MAIDVPFKILEIHVYSAQYLPPVSKMLRTFAVAWINPDHKLSTRIDHHGHTNPTWNYKLIFRVEDRFLRSERAALTVEIYNVAWLRDLPVGTAHLMINQISPPLVVNSSAIRTVSLNICRPSGHMQGILNIGINIVDNGNPKNSSILSPSELIALKIGKIEDKNGDNDNDNDEDEDYDEVEEINTNNGVGNDEKQRSSTIDEKMKVLWDEFNKTKSAEPEKGSLLIPDHKNNSDLNLKLQIKPPAYSSVASTPASPIKPLPSEIAANLKKGFYSTGHEYGSSIFENWSEETTTTDHEKKLEFLRSRNIMWTNVQDQIHHHHDQEINEKQINQKRKIRSGKSRGGGLFSCFGKGFEFTLICGGGSRSNLRRKRKEHVHYFSSAGTKSSYYPEDDFRRFYK